MNTIYIKIILLACLFVFTGFQCDREIEFEKNSLVSFEGNIVNQSGIPQSDIKVEIYGGGIEAVKVSTDITDSKGNFRASCSATNETYYIIVINEAGRLYDRRPLNNSFAPKYLYAKDTMFQDNVLTLDNMQLETPVNLKIIKSISPGDLVYYQLTSNRDVNNQLANTQQNLYSYTNSNESNDYQFAQNSIVYIEYIRNGALQNIYGQDTIELNKEDVLFEIPK